MVPHDHQYAVRLPSTASGHRSPPQAPANGQIPPRHRVSQPDGLANFRNIIAVSGVSESASRLLLASWREGTQRVYGAQFGIFTSWCTERGIDSFAPTLEQILDFLASLFDRGREYRMICVYRSMLSNALGRIDGFKVGEHPKVICLLKGVFHCRPPKKSMVPEWDLRIVLRVLKAGPFEPWIELTPNVSPSSLPSFWQSLRRGG